MVMLSFGVIDKSIVGTSMIVIGDEVPAHLPYWVFKVTNPFEPNLFQWTKDGKDLPGATNKILVTNTGGLFTLKTHCLYY